MGERERSKEWEDTVDDLIRAKFNYSDTNTALKKKFGDLGAIGGAEYREYKTKLTGGEKVDEKIDELGERKQVNKPKRKPPVWTKQKQTQADNSKLAQIINMGIYQGMLPFCANQQLKEDHVQEINPGGAVIANISYFFPESKLEHPLVMLGIRAIILYIKFKSVCGRIQKVAGGKSENASPILGRGQGLKPGMKTDKRT